MGANAVLNVSKDKWTESDACSNYRFTMHRYTGEFTVVKVVSCSSDPEVIAQAQHEMQALTDWWNSRDAGNNPADNPSDQLAGETRLVEPAKVKLVIGLVASWTWIFLRIFGLSIRYWAGRPLHSSGSTWLAGRAATRTQQMLHGRSEVARFCLPHAD